MNITEPALEAYAEAHTEPLPALLQELIEETKREFGERAGMLLRTDVCGDIVITDGPAIATPCPTDMAG